MKTKNETPAAETAATMAVVPVANNMTALQLCTNMGAVNALGQTLSQSGFFGQVSASTATAALINCFLEGLTPLQYKAKYHTFDNGQTGVKSDYVQRQFHRLGGKWKFNEWTDDVCDVTFTYQGETLTHRVTLEGFKANGVAMNGNGKMKTNWAKFPREMLKARCMATAIRAICPEAAEGMYIQEEVADFDRAPNAAAPVTVKVEAVSPSPVAEAVPVDAGICPCGKVKGKAWREIPTETLEKILATPADKVPMLTADHRNEIVYELGRRETEEQDDGEVVEPEVVK